MNENNNKTTGPLANSPTSVQGGIGQANSSSTTYTYTSSGTSINPKFWVDNIYGTPSFNTPAYRSDIEISMEYMFNLLGGFVLIHDETSGTKEVKSTLEGYSTFCTLKQLGRKVTVTKLDNEAAEILYGKSAVQKTPEKA